MKSLILEISLAVAAEFDKMLDTGRKSARVEW